MIKSPRGLGEILVYASLLIIVFLSLSYANPILRGDNRSYAAFFSPLRGELENAAKSRNRTFW